MDNITHTLVGAALAEAGLKRRTALASATLMIGANFPDIDVIAVPFRAGIEWRRGITHGFLALAILPFVLAWLMQVYDRRVRLRRHPGADPADYRQLVLLSAIAMITHPALDFMNTYGMRWLMPFLNKWFYADGLFIVDLWLLIVLVAGVVIARRRKTPRPAYVALAFLAVYTTTNLVVTGFGRRAAQAQFGDAEAMVAPRALRPWQRDVVVDEGHSYRFGRYAPFGGLRMSTTTLPKGDDSPAVRLAMEHPEGRKFLRWARLPFYRVSRTPEGTSVRISDARYSGEQGGGWASIEVRLP